MKTNPQLPTLLELAETQLRYAGPKDRNINIKITVNTAKMIVEADRKVEETLRVLLAAARRMRTVMAIGFEERDEAEEGRAWEQLNNAIQFAEGKGDFVIRLTSQYPTLGDDEPLYWSNECGWVDRDSCTVFSSQELDLVRLPINGSWAWEERVA